MVHERGLPTATPSSAPSLSILTRPRRNCANLGCQGQRDPRKSAGEIPQIRSGLQSTPASLLLPAPPTPAAKVSQAGLGTSLQPLDTPPGLGLQRCSRPRPTPPRPRSIPGVAAPSHPAAPPSPSRRIRCKEDHVLS